MKTMKFLEGRIKWSSVDRVMSVLRASYPKMMSQYKIRISTNLNQDSIPRILDYLKVKGDVERLETSDGIIYWKWVKRDNDIG